jgi:ABC-type lipoprotein export system ATPase subunit
VSTVSPLVVGADVTRDYVTDRVSTTALRAHSFLVAPGDLIALTGPSGSGKSTLLHLIAGLDTPSAGAIEWPALAGAPLRPMQITLAFQGPSLLPALTVLENVAFPLQLAGTDERTAQGTARGLLDSLDLEELASKLPDELSGGQSQRVALARALVVEPRLLLADEPTGQQDHSHAAELLDILLAHARDRGMAMIVATHDPDVAARLPIRWSLTDGDLDTGRG